MDPKAKSRANFWGAMTMTGRKEKDLESATEQHAEHNVTEICSRMDILIAETETRDIRNTPTKNMPPNLGSHQQLSFACGMGECYVKSQPADTSKEPAVEC